jgi:hypothetical protein
LRVCGCRAPMHTVTTSGMVPGVSERLARWYGEQRLAIAWTASKHGDDAKRVLTKGWPTTAPLADGDAGVAAFSANLPRETRRLSCARRA